LENQQNVYYTGKETAQELTAKTNQDTQLTAFFKLCSDNNRDYDSRRLAKSLCYWQIPEYFIWNKSQKKWTLAKKGINTEIQELDNEDVGLALSGRSNFKKTDNLGMIYDVSPSDTEKFHLRILLLHVRGPTSFKDLLTVDDITYQTYVESCLKRGYTTDDKEWERCLNDAKDRTMPYQMRMLFANILTF
jgi:hypothetical protein